jgi:hypothetical protein
VICFLRKRDIFDKSNVKNKIRLGKFQDGFLLFVHFNFVHRLLKLSLDKKRFLLYTMDIGFAFADFDNVVFYQHPHVNVGGVVDNGVVKAFFKAVKRLLILEDFHIGGIPYIISA